MCYIFQLQISSEQKRLSLDKLDRDLLQQFIPMENAQGQINDFQIAMDECDEIFEQKRKIIQSLALFTIFVVQELPGMIISHNIAKQMQDSYQEISKMDA